MLVPRLLDLQNRHGFLPDDELKRLARELDVPLYRVEEVASFFPAFRRERDRPAPLEVRVCRDMACHLRGAGALLNPDTGLAKTCGVPVEGVSCLGRCDRAPVVWIERHPKPVDEHALIFAGRSRQELERIVTALAAGTGPHPDADTDFRPHTNPGWEIDVYAREGREPDYAAVRRVADSRKSLGPRADWPDKREIDGLVKAVIEERPGESADAVRRARTEALIAERNPHLPEFKAAALQGMGGAGALAYKKWLDVWQFRDAEPGAARPIKYIVANGDESEPGTFKDRELLLRMPHLVVEGAIVAGLIAGATEGFIYIRHEYHEQIAAVRTEIARAEGLGACGADVFGTGRAYRVQVFESPGGYICGEQSALIEAMEDKRAQPRNRPPELGVNGLWNRPTAVNNVETLAWVPAIVLRGGAEYANGGWKPADDAPTAKRPRFKGRRLFSVSGDVARPGVYEVPVGLPLGELLNVEQYCGGIAGGSLKAVATSGPSGGLLPARIPVNPKFRDRLAGNLARIREGSSPDPNGDADALEWFVARHLPAGAAFLDVLAVPLDLNFFRGLNAILDLPVEPMLGAGLVVYAEGTDLLDQAVNFTQFYRNESCGKCVPCRLGSQKLVQIGSDLLAKRDAGALSADELAVVKRDVGDLYAALRQTSICGLGYVAPSPLSSALAYFPDDLR